MKMNFPVTGRELDYAETANILSTTNSKGSITHINDDFLRVSGFQRNELVGHNHNVVRHPEMPSGAFEDLWQTVQSGRSWMGLVKNRCKNGDHYWVDAFVTPIQENGEVVEYQSVRTKPLREHVARADGLYRELMAGKRPAAVRRPRIGLRTKLLMGTALAVLPAIGFGIMAGLPLGLAAIAFLLALSLGGVTTQLLLGPLSQATSMARNIVDNPVAQHIYTGRRDEIGQLLLALKMLESEAGGIVGRIADSSDELGERFDEVAVAISQMAASVQEVARNAQQTAEAANQANRDAQSGKSVVESTSSSIQALSKEVDRATQVIHELEKQSDNINAVLDAIQRIAAQTNLLAINASIEAARAGHHGRGFAVVAREVRALAERTQHATEEIQGIISKLGEMAGQAVDVMANSRKQADISVEHANAAARSLESITQAVATISNMSVQIAVAVEQQSAASEEMKSSIGASGNPAGNSLDSAQSKEHEDVGLSGLAKGLQQLVQQFWDKRRH